MTRNEHDKLHDPIGTHYCLKCGRKLSGIWSKCILCSKTPRLNIKKEDLDKFQKEFAKGLALDKLKLVAKAKWSEHDEWNPRITPEEAKTLLDYIKKSWRK